MKRQAAECFVVRRREIIFAMKTVSFRFGKVDHAHCNIHVLHMEKGAIVSHALPYTPT